MAIFCIPKNLVTKLKESALKGEVNIKELLDMSSVERRNYLSGFTDPELGKMLNTEFEKAIVSKQKSALTDWAKSVFSPQAKAKPVFKTVLDKINALDEIGVMKPESQKAFLEDLVSDKLGINVSPEEVKAISEKAQKIDAAQVKLGNDLGNPAKEQETLEFFQAKREMDDYLQTLAPASNLKILTGTIGRGMMLFSAKSPILNIGSNVEIGFAEALSRRIADFGLRGADNSKAVKYVKMVNRIYQKTGYDLSRMTSITDSGASGERVLGQTVHAQGKGAVRLVGRVVEDIVFKQLMGAPDVAFSSAHFADSVNINAMKLANGDKAQAALFMEDAMRLTPQTAEGEILRQQGIMDAQKSTWTDKSWATKISNGIRTIFNDVSGDFRVGDYLFPFVKTPANVIAMGMDYAGMGIPKAMIDTVKAVRSGELGSREYRQSVSRNLVRSGLGLAGAAAIAFNLDDDDFVGAYDPARAQIESLRNSNYNAIRIGNKWVSVDWLGPLAVPVSAMMFARKYGSTPGEKTFQYGKGVLSAVKNLPGVSDAYDFIRTNAYKKNQSLEEMTGEARNYLIDQVSSRLIPSFVSDVAKATDTSERVSTKGAEALKAKIPGLRQSLPEKRTILGEVKKTEPAWSVILFGSRVRTSQENNTIKELSNVSDNTGKGINFTDWDKSSSAKLAQFKEKKGKDIYDRAKVEYGQEIKKNLDSTMKQGKYQKMSDDEKLTVINGIDTDAMNKVFKKYGFKYISKKK